MSDELCADCPPVGYPTDETRCLPCPRRADHIVDANELVAPSPPDGEVVEPIEDVAILSEVCGFVRDAAKRLTGGNCTFVDDDIAIIEHLAKRAIEAGLTDGLHPSVQRRLPAAPVSPRPDWLDTEIAAFEAMRDELRKFLGAGAWVAFRGGKVIGHSEDFATVAPLADGRTLIRQVDPEPAFFPGIVVGAPWRPSREAVIEAIRAELSIQNPDVRQLEGDSVWLSGGVTPQSAGTVLYVADIADAILALRPEPSEVDGGGGR